MRHLGDQVSALVDGELPPAVAERALAHVAWCAPCRALLDAERAARRTLAQAPDVEPSGALTARLLAVVPQPAAGGPGSPPGGPRRRPWLERAAVGVGGAVGAAAAVVGALAVVGTSVSPVLTGEDVLSAAAVRAAPMATAGFADGDVSTYAPAVEPVSRPDRDLTHVALTWMTDHGWSSPAVVPADLAVTDLRVGRDGGLRVEFVSDSSRITVLERRGVLAGGDGNTEAIAGSSARLLSTSPWTAAVQSGDCVVVVVCEGSVGDCRRLLAAIPEQPADTSPAAQVARGWRTVTAVVRDAVGD